MNIFRKQKRENEFWDWFQKNEDRLFHFTKDQDTIFSALSSAMHKVHSDLTFEFGPEIDGKREFVISADGQRNVFPTVESLFTLAPSLPRWTFTKFRPRRHAAGMVHLNGLEIKAQDVEVSMEADGEKVGLNVFMLGYDSEDRRYLNIAFIILDHIIGEFDMETKVGFINVKPFDETSLRTRFSLDFLPIAFDDFAMRK